MSLYKIFLSNQNNGTIELSLPHANWQDTKRTYERDELYQGVIIKYSIALEFVKEGANYIKNIYETEGFNASCSINIYEFDYISLRYEVYYVGELDFSTYNPFETSIQINAIQGSEIENLLNSDDIEINILASESLNGTTLPDFTPYLHDLYLHSQILERKYLSQNDDSILVLENTISKTADAIGLDPGFVVFPQLKEKEISNDFSSQEIPSYPAGLSNINPQNISKYILNNEFGGEYIFDIEQEYSVSIDLSDIGADINLFQTTIFIEFNIFGQLDETNNQFDHFLGSTGDVYTESIYSLEEEYFDPYPQIKTYNINIDINRTIEIPRNARVYIMARLAFDTSVVPEGVYPKIELNQVKNYVNIEAKTTEPGSITKAVYEHDVIARVCDMILDKPESFRSDFLGRINSYGRAYLEPGKEPSMMLTNGAYLKGNGEGNDSMIFKLSDLFKSLNAKYNLALSFENNPQTGKLLVRLEEKEYVYANQEIINIGCVSDLEKRINLDLVYNQVLIGYKDKKPKDAKIDADFTSPKTRKIPINSVKNELDIINKFIAQGSTIEETRRNFILPLDKQDNGKDDDIFMITTYLDDATGEIRSISGVEQFNDTYDNHMLIDSYNSSKDLSTAYNLYLLPVHIYQKYWGKDIKAIFQKQINFGNDYFDRFISGTNLTDVEIIINGKSYKDDANYNIKDYEKPLWIPENYIFDKELNYNQLKTLTKNQNGFIIFENRRGNEKKGFLLKLEIDDSSKVKKCSFTILRKNDAI